MGKHAYLIIAHNQYPLLKKLVTLLDDKRNDIYIHLDKKMQGVDIEELKTLCQKSILKILDKRISVNWGGKSIIDVEMELLKASIHGHYDYYHLLSGMDLPLKSQDEIHAFFDQNQGTEFLDMWKLKESTHTRFHYYTVFPEGESHFLKHACNNVVKGILIAFRIRMNKDIKFYYGSQWFSITDDFAKFIVSQESWVEKTFRHTSICDEVFIPTLLHRSSFLDKLSRQRDEEGHIIGNMRFIDWTRGTSIRHPYTYTIEDYALLKSVPQLFARKFSMNVDDEIINKLYEELKRD